MKRILIGAALAGGSLIAFRSVPPPPPDITLPAGFEVQEVLSPDTAESVVGLTFDSHGRMVLAKEFGNVVTLIPKQDGTYEQRIFTDQVHTSQGINFDGPDLLVSGAGPQGVGLYRVVDDDGDARGDSVQLIELATAAIQDHGPHAPVWGPDGYLYWNMGNFSNLYDDPAPLSPVRDYEQGVLIARGDPRGFGNNRTGGPGGVFFRKQIDSKGTGINVRRSPESNDWQLVAMGFRNPYDFTFNLMGEMFTLDSDMEWDRDLPWYRGTRTVHVVPGGDYGYREGTGKHPAYFFDDLPPITDQGRGSPTGLVVYDAYNYPEQYQGMVLQADWSRGRVIGTTLTKDGASYTGQSIDFMYGEPLNVTDLDVGPDGNVYFALGGRSTAGGIYRIVYTGSDKPTPPQASSPIDSVLTMIQPRSAYSREEARRIRDEMGIAAWQQALTAEARNAQSTPDRRVRALELLQVYGPGLDENVLTPLLSDPAWEVRAGAAYYLGMKTSSSARNALINALKDSDAFVQRRAAEALLRTGVNPTMDAGIDPVEDIFPLLASNDRFLRFAARELLQQIDSNEWKEQALHLTRYPAAEEALLAYVETMNSPDIWDVTRFVQRELELLKANPSDAELLNLTRLIQRTILETNGVRDIPGTSSEPGVMQERGAEGIHGGRQPGVGGGGGRGRGERPLSAFEQIGQIMLAHFPAADTALSRELGRTMAALETDGANAKLAAELSNPQNSREQQIAYASYLSFMKSGWDATTMKEMTDWLGKVYDEGWKGGASFSNAITQIEDGFLENIPRDQYAAMSERIQELHPQVATAPGQFGRGPSSESDEEIYENIVFRPDQQGEPAGGVAAFQKAGCNACHTFGPIGTEFGPDLTTVGQRFSLSDLARAVVFPSETVSSLYQAETITRTNGQQTIGIVTGETSTALQVMVAGGASISIPKSQVQSRAPSTQSVMPQGLMRALNTRERGDLFALLQAGPSAIPDSTLARVNAQ